MLTTSAMQRPLNLVMSQKAFKPFCSLSEMQLKLLPEYRESTVVSYTFHSHVYVINIVLYMLYKHIH